MERTEGCDADGRFERGRRFCGGRGPRLYLLDNGGEGVIVSSPRPVMLLRVFRISIDRTGKLV